MEGVDEIALPMHHPRHRDVVLGNKEGGPHRLHIALHSGFDIDLCPGACA